MIQKILVDKNNKPKTLKTQETEIIFFKSIKISTITTNMTETLPKNIDYITISNNTHKI